MAAYLQASAKAALPPGSSAPPAALSDFATTSGLAAVFGALNLSVDVHEQCLARTVQWFQDVGVRSRNTSRHLATIAMARASTSALQCIPCAALGWDLAAAMTSARLAHLFDSLYA